MLNSVYKEPVKSSPAHVLPSSPVSVGILPSKRTLEAGDWHLIAIALPNANPHLFVAEEPLTETVAGTMKMD